MCFGLVRFSALFNTSSSSFSSVSHFNAAAAAAAGGGAAPRAGSFAAGPQLFAFQSTNIQNTRRMGKSFYREG